MDDNSDKYSGAVGMEIFLSIPQLLLLLSKMSLIWLYVVSLAPFQVRNLGAEFYFIFLKIHFSSKQKKKTKFRQ
jgi:hypothetical protein